MRDPDYWYTPQMKLLCSALLLSLAAFGQDDAPAGSRSTVPTPPPPGRVQARSMIVTKFGIVATSQFLASQAGAKMLEAGQSQPWQQTLKEMTGTDHLDAQAMLDYFAPLYQWLKEQNKAVEKK